MEDSAEVQGVLVAAKKAGSASSILLCCAAAEDSCLCSWHFDAGMGKETSTMEKHAAEDELTWRQQQALQQRVLFMRASSRHG